jgi:hypothetical protein
MGISVIFQEVAIRICLEANVALMRAGMPHLVPAVN